MSDFFSGLDVSSERIYTTLYMKHKSLIPCELAHPTGGTPMALFAHFIIGLPRLLFGALLLAHGFAPAKEPGLDNTAGSPKSGGAAITLRFIGVDITQNGGCEWPWYAGPEGPLIEFEYKSASGAIALADSAMGQINLPNDYSDGTAFYFPGAVVGEAVLIKVTSQSFPSDIKTYITYNVATSGNFDGTQLRSSQPPPYYNTIPVEGKFWERMDALPGNTGVGLHPVLCDSSTSPSIGVPPLSTVYGRFFSANQVNLSILSPNLNQSYDHVFPPLSPPINHGIGFYWGPSGNTVNRDLYLGTMMPSDPLLQYSVSIQWPMAPFFTATVTTLLEFGKGDLYDIPMEGGHGAIQLLLLSTTDRFSSEIYAKPPPNLLLEAAIEAVEGRAILSSHLFPLCDLNSNGQIDQADIEALRSKVLCGMITY